MQREYRFKGLQSFVVYYGHGEEERLAAYDLLILEPKGHSAEELCALKQRGKTICAYLSVVEIHRRDEAFATLGCEDFLRNGEACLVNPEYDTLYMDISSTKVQNLIIHRASDLLKSGYDGVFLDTLGDIDYLQLPCEVKVRLLSAAGLIAEEIKRLFPTAILIQNNGLIRVCDYTNAYLDGICFENPPCGTWGQIKWSISALKRLDRLKRDYNIQVFLLQENCKEGRTLKAFVLRLLCKKLSKMKGYLYYETDKYYNKV